MDYDPFDASLSFIMIHYDSFNIYCIFIKYSLNIHDMSLYAKWIHVNSYPQTMVISRQKISPIHP